MSQDDEMTKYGITYKRIDRFFYGEYQYTSYKDALSQAKRDESTKRP